MSDDINIIQTLCEGQPEHIQRLIKAAYYKGCSDGMELVNNPVKIEKKEGNVVFLRPLNSVPQ